ncbi:branched-chain amino acid transaminase [Pedobacter panaciterrae]|jgi:branched-chain amino acid aminotransferase, group I|uniref:Branched-chain-amino-acid aminotransferase n=1 Tax=Pedobacter panaciterrae TaxID=363849 RepID=A0ABU8NIE7_9SPHI|nr:branched-chain amino acid transaminase [Pedobacter panaciterrae]NQX54055.1 branched-chain amino acid transaminase [Pedobacter panaciterrae]
MQYFNSNTILYLNGRFEKAADSNADLYGQSLHYGYAVFEGIRAYSTHNGTRIFKAREHFERLKRSAELVHIPFTWDINKLIKQTYRLLEINNLKDAYIRPLIYCPPAMSLVAAKEASIMICVWDWEAYLGHKLLKVCVSSFERPNPKSTPIEAKVSGNYVNSILATTEAKRKGFDEALLLDMYGNVAEAPGANIFIEKNGRLYTPPLGNILPGITRATVIELCHILDIEIIEKHLSVKDLKHADSAFFCGTATEIAGIGSVDEYTFPLKWTDSVGATIQRTYKSLVLEKQNYEVII